jgi:hypothetical protein
MFVAFEQGFELQYILLGVGHRHDDIKESISLLRISYNQNGIPSKVLLFFDVSQPCLPFMAMFFTFREGAMRPLLKLSPSLKLKLLLTGVEIKPLSIGM